MNNMNIKTIAKIVALAIILLSKTLERLLHLSAAAIACVGGAIMYGILLQTLIQILRTQSFDNEVKFFIFMQFGASVFN